jgi:heme-degrading monooxygenase HmoA
MVSGPLPRRDGPVVVSLTELTPRYTRDWPLIARDGLALTRGWWAMAGAIGVVLYADVRHRCGGSLSLWASEEDLRRFVSLPRHAAIMRRYRDRGTVRAAVWTTEDVDLDATLARREVWLTT